MKFCLSYLVAAMLLLPVALSAQPTVYSLKTDYKFNPMGIDHAFPRLSWIIGSEEPNTLQESYEIRAALDPEDLSRGRRLLWETGRVVSPQSIHVPFSGPPVGSFQRVYWQVRVGDSHGKTSRWSEVASWETGFLPDAAWEAEWITPTWEEDPLVSMPSPYLRKEFRVENPVREARLYITSLGLYQVELNGQRVGDQEFTPGWTSYDTRLQYQTYDVTDQLQRDLNAIGIILGDGWFRGNLGWVDNRNHWGSRLAALAELRVTYTDGTTAVVGTDGSWGASKGPILISTTGRCTMPTWN